MFRTLRARLTLSYAAVAVLCLLLALVVLLVLARDYAVKNGFKTLQEKKALVVPYVVQRAISETQRPLQRLFAPAAASIRRAQVRILLLNPETYIIEEDTMPRYQSEGKRFPLNDTDPHFDQLLNTGELQGTVHLPGEDTTFQYVAQRVPASVATLRDLLSRLTGAAAQAQQARRPRYIVVIEQPQPGIAALISELGGYILIGAFATLIVSLIAAFVLGRSLSRPVARLAAAARAVASGDYSQKVPVRGKDELATLAEQFNDMASEIGRSHQTQRDFVANVSHDLKTPLTSIQGFSQAMLDGATRTEADYRQAALIINNEAQRMSRMVSELLDLTRLQNGLATLELRPVDLAPVLSQLVLTMQPHASNAGVELAARLRVPSAFVMCDLDRLKQAIGNLMENAIKYTPGGGNVTLELQEIPTGIRIDIIDSGEGIPPEELSRVMERFYQVDKARSSGDKRSMGLGLAIAREIILAHHGEISIDSAPGVGTTVHLSLPALTPRADSGRLGRQRGSTPVGRMRTVPLGSTTGNGTTAELSSNGSQRNGSSEAEAAAAGPPNASSRGES